MSKKLNIYQISVPYIPNTQKEFKEQEVFRGFDCSHCHGNGWNWGYDEDGERANITCPVCNGSGILKAVVTTEWKADKKEK